MNYWNYWKIRYDRKAYVGTVASSIFVYILAAYSAYYMFSNSPLLWFTSVGGAVWVLSFMLHAASLAAIPAGFLGASHKLWLSSSIALAVFFTYALIGLFCISKLTAAPLGQLLSDYPKELSGPMALSLLVSLCLALSLLKRKDSRNILNKPALNS